MKMKRDLRAAGACAVVLSAGVVGPATSQESGGVTGRFTVESGVEATRNPSLTAGSDDLRTIISTDLGFSVRSETRRAVLELSTGASLRYAFGDGAASDEEIQLGDETVTVSYSTEAPRAAFDASVRYSRDDLSFIPASELVTETDGTISVTEDFTDIAGTGTRENIDYRFSAEFDRDRRFGWGATVSGSYLTYSDVTAPTLEDNSTRDTTLTAHFDVTPTLRIDTQARYAQRDTETGDETATRSFSVAASAVRSDDLTLRGGMTVSDPDENARRLTLTGGVTLQPGPRSNLGLEVGTVFSDGFDRQLVGTLSYDFQPAATSRYSVQLTSEVTDSVENAVVVNSAARIGADFEMTRLSSVSLDVIFANEDTITAGTEQTELSTSIQLNRQLTRDAQVSMGLSHTSRRETGLADASSQGVFLKIGRNWTGRM